VSPITNDTPPHTNNDLPWSFLDPDYPPSCTFLGCILQLCKVSSVLAHLLEVAFMRNMGGRVIQIYLWGYMYNQPAYHRKSPWMVGGKGKHWVVQSILPCVLKLWWLGCKSGWCPQTEQSSQCCWPVEKKKTTKSVNICLCTMYSV